MPVKRQQSPLVRVRARRGSLGARSRCRRLRRLLLAPLADRLLAAPRRAREPASVGPHARRDLRVPRHRWAMDPGEAACPTRSSRTSPRFPAMLRADMIPVRAVRPHRQSSITPARAPPRSADAESTPCRVISRMRSWRIGRIAVLISGRGSNLQALIDAIADGRLQRRDRGRDRQPRGRAGTRAGASTPGSRR